MRMKKAKHLKPVPIMLDKKRTLVYDFNSFIRLKEKTQSTNMVEAVGTLKKSIVTDGDLGSLRTLLWAGLIHEDKDLEEETVGSMIVIDKLPEIMAAMTKAFNRTAGVGKWK